MDRRVNGWTEVERLLIYSILPYSSELASSLTMKVWLKQVAVV